MSGRQEGYLGTIAAGETIKLRVGPQVDRPLKIVGLDVEKALREIAPIFGTALCFQRLEDKPRWKKRPRDTEEPLVGAAYTVSEVKLEEEPAPDEVV